MAFLRASEGEMKGRKALPNNVHKLRGSFREDRHGGGIQAAAVLPDPPEGLPELAKQEWHRAAKELHKHGLLTALDLVPFEMYCRVYAQWIEAEENLEHSDMIFKTQTGYQAVGAAFVVAGKLRAELLKIGAEFGLTPATRARMKAIDNQPQQLDMFGEFLNKKRKKHQNG
jgi:P27 family predicted phage terminase small subunit